MKYKTITSVFILFIYSIGLLTVLVGCKSPIESIEEESERSYTKTIERTYSNEFERSLIDSAEAAYPPRDSVLAAVWPPSFQEYIPEYGYWFYRRIDGVLIPFAITIDVVDYYSSLLDSMESGGTHQHIHTAEFEYRASVSFEDAYEFQWPEDIIETYIELTGQQPPEESFQMVYVVEKKMRWHHRCGADLDDLCGLWVNNERVVIFDENGLLIRIFLDGVWWVPMVS